MQLTISENFRAVFYAPFYALQVLDFAKVEGLDIKWLPSERPGSAIEAVKSGRIDAMFGGPMRVLKDHDSPADGKSLVCFGEVVARDPFFLIGRQRARFHLRDVADMRVGLVSEVPTPSYCLLADLADAGVDTAAMRAAGRFVEKLSMPQQVEALASGELDAAQLFEPYVSRALAKGNAILYAAHTRGPCVYTTFLTSRDSAQKRAAEFAALERATHKLLEWVWKKGPAEMARVTAPFFPDLPSTVLRSALERYHRAGLWPRNPRVSEHGFARLSHSLHAGGFIARRSSYAECVTSFAKPA